MNVYGVGAAGGVGATGGVGPTGAATWSGASRRMGGTGAVGRMQAALAAVAPLLQTTPSSLVTQLSSGQSMLSLADGAGRPAVGGAVA